MQNKNSETLLNEFIEEMSNYFPEQIEDFVVISETNTPHITFQVEFVMYKYFNMILNYDRGRFGCSIINGSRYIPLENSQKWYDEADMSIFLKELKQQVRLRIPDKFLVFYNWS